MKSKDELRHDIRLKRAELTLRWIDESSRAAVAFLRELDLFQNAETIACFLSKPFEVQTQPFIERCLTEGKRVCVPRNVESHLGYEWSWIRPGDAWRDGPWRIAEPAHYLPVDDKEIDLAIVSAVAVDRQGNRLGHGGGNYDRLLQRVTGTRLALIFDFQRVDEVPAEPHDVPVNRVVTETGAYSVRS